jgi:opacity protein-like surface antigen
MTRSMALACAAAVFLASGRFAGAVDLPPAPALPIANEAEPEFAGWYLRGDIGLGVAAAEPELAAAPLAGPAAIPIPAVAWTSHATTSPFGLVDVGVGYRFNAWFRMDGTLVYRGGGFRARSGWADPLGGPATYAYSDRAGLSSIVGLVNAYADLGTYWGFTPFLGAGAGVADTAAGGFRDSGVGFTARGPFAPAPGSLTGGSRTSFAWALMAGVGFDVAPGLRLELGYRYLSYGSPAVSGWRCQAGADAAPCGGVPLIVGSRGRLASSDLRFGLIWTLGTPAFGQVAIRD